MNSVDLEELRQKFTNVKYNEEHVWRGKIIDGFVQKYNFTSYLEIGYLDGLTFNLVNCKNKIGVDPNPRNKNQMVVSETSDSFFNKNTQKFDIIFIDGYHEKHQVYRDFENSYKFLNDGGVIIFHDVNPFTEEGTLQTGHGDCFQTWLNLYEHYELRTYSNYFDTIGIFYKKINPEFKDTKWKDFTWLEFESNRKKYIYDLQIDEDLNF